MSTEHMISRSKQLFDNGFGCAEAVLISAAETLGIESDLIPRIIDALEHPLPLLAGELAGPPEPAGL